MLFPFLIPSLKILLYLCYNSFFYPAARFCVTAIAVETLGVAVAAFTQLEMSPQITQITVARSRRTGERNLMLGQNPVWIVTGQKEALL